MPIMNTEIGEGLKSPDIGLLPLKLLWIRG